MLQILGGLLVAIVISLGVIKALELIRNRVDNSKGEEK
ncbi:hypothetical protein EVC20_116 [Rhizobium phage RHph_Y2_17_1]|nr:hypothetical protein EVC19_116 [Rhizobium phage RHph_Y2_11]QIG75855.1 hypothetical protein EVC20_116 [Rhizobium phage RHph_Y2_17_1]